MFSFFTGNRNRQEEQRGYVNGTSCGDGPAGTVMIKYPIKFGNNFDQNNDSHYAYMRVTSYGRAVIACGKRDAVMKCLQNLPGKFTGYNFKDMSVWGKQNPVYDYAPGFPQDRKYWICTIEPDQNQNQNQNQNSFNSQMPSNLTWANQTQPNQGFMVTPNPSYGGKNRRRKTNGKGGKGRKGGKTRRRKSKGTKRR